jgi:hypothetical protein
MHYTWERRDELKALIRQFLDELRWEMEQQLDDPDAGTRWRPRMGRLFRGVPNEKDWAGQDPAEVMDGLSWN